MTAQYSLKERQDLVNTFQENSKTKHLIRAKISGGMMRLISTGINLIRVRQIIIVDLEYISYIE